MRLIDADAVREDLYDADAITMRGVAIINRSPTIDAVPVVRCKDCKHCDPESKHCDHPMGTAMPVPRKEDDFCSYGERRSDATD